MRILHVNKFFDERGGAEVYLHELMSKQREEGHEVHVFSTESPENEPSTDKKYFVERFDLSRREGWWKDLKKARNFLWNSEARLQIRRMIHEVNPDVIHLHNVYHHLSSSILGPIRVSRIPAVMTLHDYNLASPNYAMFDQAGVCAHGKDGHYFEIVKHRCAAPEYLANFLAALEITWTKSRQAYEKTIQLFLCPSRFMQKKMEEWHEPAEQMRYVPNPTDLPERIALRGGGYVLYAGRLSREKGLSSMIEAALEVPNLKIKIAGKGPEEESLKSLVKRLNIKNIEFLGFVPKEELAMIRDHAEAVVLPTVSYENASGSLLEAMAAGLPCLGTKTGGNPELVKDEENGFLVTPGDITDWSRVLKRFTRLSEAEREKMGRQSRERILRNHTWPQHLERIKRCYEEAKRLIK
ncbi:MAG TPA: glycosyltransferase family 4 protein [Patescibacteria group bacterium]|nr:glycosyltransferase family 4 protein [Patescibacteria group bacterium]